MYESLSDVDLVAGVAGCVSVPRRESPDSFVLHAPLELLARASLLPHVSPLHREAARRRIVDIATQYEAFGEGIGPAAPGEFDSTEAAAARLIEAIGRGELSDADTAAAWLGDHAAADELGVLLGDAVVPSLAAAGHSPIFLAQWANVDPRHRVTGQLLRPIARSLAANPDWRIEWIDKAPTPTGPAPSGGSLFDVLAATPIGSRPKVDFIHPTMRLVDDDPTAARLAPVTLGLPPEQIATAATEVARVAAWTMLDEPGPHSPYLWTHCLTMPQAVLALRASTRTPARHLAVAATHVTGFRSAFATHTLIPSPPPPVAVPLTEAIGAGPVIAAGAAWATTTTGRRDVVKELVDRAATHPDAHVAKYTVACLDAAATDSPAAALYLAAAASLAGWWATAM